MKIRIVYEDIHHMAHLLQRRFGDTGKNLNDLRRYIRADFLAAEAKIAPLTRPDRPTYAEARILVIADRVPEHTGVLAYFDPERSAREGENSFGIYYDTLRQWLEQDWLGQADAGAATGFPDRQALWIHEMIHMLDFESLRRFMVQREGALASDVRGRADAFGDSLLRLRHWPLTQTFSVIRAEGIACLHDALRGGVFPEGDDLRRKENQLNNLILETCTLLQDADVRDATAEARLSEMLAAARAIAYKVGPDLVLRVLAASSPPSAVASGLVDGSRSTSSLTDDEVMELVGLAMEMDMSRYLSILFRLHVAEPAVAFHGEAVFQALNVLTGSEETDRRVVFLQEVHRCAESGDSEALVNVIRGVVGSKMGQADVEAGLRAFAGRGESDGIDLEIRDAVAAVEKWYRQDEGCHDWLAWVLTYVLDPEDFLCDREAVVGMLDDYYVLTAALKILARTAS
jgi:hypothetical protein